MRRLRGVFLLVGGFLLIPTLVHAQATLAGVVRDNTGAVLPGVTVEAPHPPAAAARLDCGPSCQPWGQILNRQD